MDEEILLLQISEEESLLSEVRANLEELRLKCMHLETYLIEHKLKQENLIEQLRMFRNGLPQIDIKLKADDMNAFKIRHVELMDKMGDKILLK